MEMVACPHCEALNPGAATSCQSCRCPLRVASAPPPLPAAAGAQRPSSPGPPPTPALARQAPLPITAGRPQPRYAPRPTLPRRGLASESQDERGINSMRAGGFVLLAYAVWLLVQPWILSFWLELDNNRASTLVDVGVAALLGAAMLQGSGIARQFVLWMTALGSAGLVFLLISVNAAGFGHLWPIIAAGLCSLVGVWALNIRRRPPAPWFFAALGLVVAGWVGSTVATVVLVGAPGLGTMKMIADWSSPDRSYDNPERGVALRAPLGWVILKSGNPIMGEDTALVTLASTEIVGFAQLHTETPATWAEGLGQYTQNLIGTFKAEHEDFQALDNSEGKIGEIATRRVRMAWKTDDARIQAWISVWQDGDTFWYLSLLGPRAIAHRLESELGRLEQSVTFDAPWSTFLSERRAELQAAVPFLSERALLVVARVTAKDAPPETFFREAYRLAFEGRPLLDGASTERLRVLMQSLFNAIPRGEIGRFGAYVERVRSHRPTSPVEDRAMAAVARSAVSSLPVPAQDDLRAYLGMAIAQGEFSRSQTRF